MNRTYAYTNLEASEDNDALRDLATQAFDFPASDWESFVTRVGRQTIRLVRLGDRVVGGLAFYRMGQWFGGRCLPVAGVTLVCVAAEDRNSGASTFLLSSTLEELHAEGLPLAALFASTQQPYRGVGFEQAGNWCRYEMRLDRVGIHHRPVPLRKVDPARHQVFHALADQRARLTNGNLQRGEGIWNRVVDGKGKDVYAYLVGEQHQESGYLIYAYENAPPWSGKKLIVQDMVALSKAAAVSLWALLSGHRSITESVTWRGPATDPLLILPKECKPRIVDYERWMLRILDVRRALGERGYPPDVDGELHLEVTDDLLPSNGGRFVLRVRDGRGEVSEGGRGLLRTDARGLAPLFSGLFTPHQLCAFGQIAADDKTLNTAARIFAGPEPWMPDMF